jgi:hypothetical protein
MDPNTLKRLLEKFNDGSLSNQEHNLFVEWLSSIPPEDANIVLDKIADLISENPVKHTHDLSSLISDIELRLDKHDSGLVKNFFLPKSLLLKIAAVFLLFGTITFLYIHRTVNRNHDLTARNIAKIDPGKNQAYIKLTTGVDIALEHVSNGLLAEDRGIQIVKVADGEVQFKQTANGRSFAGQIHMIVPRGGQYKVRLVDGTAIWLNAASELTVPLYFSSVNRTVQLQGEGYFEVAKNKLKPFMVQSKKATVQVYGTHFNVCAYNDDPLLKTTLLEGSIDVKNGLERRMLKPGQQAIVAKSISVLKVNPTEAVEWKNGNLNFSHEDIRSIMQKIARWYDVTIEYKGNITSDGYVGTVPRSTDIRKVLHLLELTRTVHFKIDGRRVIVMK